MQEEITQPQQLYTRTIHLEKCASMMLMEVGGQAVRKFHLSEATMKRILIPEHQQKNADLSVLQRVHVHSVSLGASSKNQYPFALGIKIHGLPGTIYDEQGQDWSFIFPPDSNLSQNILIFESSGDEKLMKSWEDEFPRWTADNLETVCAMVVPETEIVMTHIEHPVVQLLEKKYEQFQTQAPSQTQMSQQNWYNISKPVFTAACRWLRENILSKSTKTHDFSQLTVTFGKIDNGKFTDLPPSCFQNMSLDENDTIEEINKKKNAFGNVLMQRCFGLTLRLCIEYRLANMDS